MQLSFITPTRISLIDLTTIGDSIKRGDSTKIGKFSSGQAYATALLLRAGVEIKVVVHNEYPKSNDTYRYKTVNRVCASTGKQKEVIQILHSEAGRLVNTIDTAFALQLGYNWELWMALRELWSNMLDEGGYIFLNGRMEIEVGTKVTLTFDEDNEFFKVWENRHLYINEKKPLYVIKEGRVEAIENKEGYLRIYKQNILVYEDKNRKSLYAYNCFYGDIDERRILSNLYSLEQDVASAIMNTNNADFLKTIITKDFYVEENDFLSDSNVYQKASDLLHDIAYEVYQEHGEVSSFSWLLTAIRNRKDCKIGRKKLHSLNDSLWEYSNHVTVESFKEDSSPLQKEIDKHYKFDLNGVVVKTASLSGGLVIADKYEKCLYIDEKFTVKDHFGQFLVQYLYLTKEGNVIDSLSEMICNTIKKCEV